MLDKETNIVQDGIILIRSGLVVFMDFLGHGAIFLPGIDVYRRKEWTRIK
jgi:hypothetical protein